MFKIILLLIVAIFVLGCSLISVFGILHYSWTLLFYITKDQQIADLSWWLILCVLAFVSFLFGSSKSNNSNKD